MAYFGHQEAHHVSELDTISTMCGIAGVLDYRHGVRPTLIQDMCARISHRGPDDEGWYAEGPVALGNRRLAILDLSTAGHQPMASDDGKLHIVYNGEVYNFRDIRKELMICGRKFNSNTDTEVVLQAYREWGGSCLAKFNGMFSFAIWDEDKRELFIARDRMGIKPLYYYFNGRRLVFASEIKAMLADEQVPFDISPVGLSNYLTFGHSVAPDTIFEGVKKLRPGHFMRCIEGQSEQISMKIEPYWTVPVPGSNHDLGKDHYVERLQDILYKSVERHLISDVPVGVFLSGGIDSSAITGIMSSVLGRATKTFSVGFESSDLGYDELADARTVAQHFNTDHHELVLTQEDLVRSLDKLVYFYDEPFGDAAAFPTYLLAEFARAYVPVALSGEGSDEIFGGYRRYIAEKWATHYSIVPQYLRNIIARASSRMPVSQRLSRALQGMTLSPPLRRYMSWLTVYTEEMKGALLKTGLNDSQSNPGWETHSAFYCHNFASSVDRVLYLDQQTWLPDTYLEKVDKATMAVGLEARVPFLDVEMVEFAATIPSKYKVRGLTTKYILKEAVKDILPRQILKKPKHGFSVPLAPWFRGRLRGVIEEILFDPRARSRGFFNYEYIEVMYERHVRGEANYYKQLWLLVVFEKWYQEFVERHRISRKRGLDG